MQNILEDINTLNELKKRCLLCRECGLAATRQSVVFGEGREDAEIFLLGEAPGAREDETGRPFAGRAGELLTGLLAAAGIDRKEVFITGSVKCRPPKNRNPRGRELKSCYPYLKQQLAIIRPKVVICLGLVAVGNILDKKASLKEVRSRWFNGAHYLIYPTYHPAAVLRGTVKPEILLDDFRAVAGRIGR